MAALKILGRGIAFDDADGIWVYHRDYGAAGTAYPMDREELAQQVSVVSTRSLDSVIRAVIMWWSWCRSYLSLCFTFPRLAEDMIFYNSGESKLHRVSGYRDVRVHLWCHEEKPGCGRAYPWVKQAVYTGHLLAWWWRWKHLALAYNKTCKKIKKVTLKRFRHLEWLYGNGGVVFLTASSERRAYTWSSETGYANSTE